MKQLLTMIVIVLSCFTLKAQEMNHINARVIKLFVATDNANWEEVARSFAPKVRLDYSSMNGNLPSELTPDQIIEAWKGILPGFTSTHHQLGNFISEINGNKASLFCYGTASHYLPDEKGNLWTVVGSYNFDLKKINDQWKITSMKFNFKYQDGNATLPEKAIKNATK